MSIAFSSKRKLEKRLLSSKVQTNVMWNEALRVTHML